MCSRNDDPTTYDDCHLYSNTHTVEDHKYFSKYLDTILSAEECEKIMQESEGRSCANPQEHAFVHVYPPTAKTEEELEEKLLVQPYNCGPELLARSIHSCSFPYSGPYCPVHEAWVNYLNA